MEVVAVVVRVIAASVVVVRVIAAAVVVVAVVVVVNKIPVTRG